MARSPRSIELLIQSIRQSLDEAREAGHQFCLAMWSEADSDAGYLVHVDGRMVAVGDYQHGFSRVEELANPGDTDELRMYARQEAGRMAGGIAPISAGDLEELVERLPYAFQADSEFVGQVAAAGQVSIQEMFDLLSAAPASLVMAGARNSGDKFQLLQDVSVARIVAGDGGKLAWQTALVGRAGDTVEGSAVPGAYAYLQVEGGFVPLQPEQFHFERPAPACRHPNP